MILFSFGQMFYHSFGEYVCLELQVYSWYLRNRLSIQYVDCVRWFHHTVPSLATFEKVMSSLATRKMEIFGSRSRNNPFLYCQITNWAVCVVYKDYKP